MKFHKPYCTCPACVAAREITDDPDRQSEDDIRDSEPDKDASDEWALCRRRTCRLYCGVQRSDRPGHLPTGKRALFRSFPCGQVYARDQRPCLACTPLACLAGSADLLVGQSKGASEWNRLNGAQRHACECLTFTAARPLRLRLSHRLCTWLNGLPITISPSRPLRRLEMAG